MGDRANIKIKGWEEDKDVFFYTHSGGTNLPNTLRDALGRKLRWNDSPYLARIIFQQMIGDDHSEFGFGISGSVGDGDDRILTVDVDAQTVTSTGGGVWSFKDYITLTPEELDQVWGEVYY